MYLSHVRLVLLQSAGERGNCTTCLHPPHIPWVAHLAADAVIGPYLASALRTIELVNTTDGETVAAIATGRLPDYE